MNSKSDINFQVALKQNRAKRIHNKQYLSILECERGSTRFHLVENLLWKRLWTCHKTDYTMNLCTSSSSWFVSESHDPVLVIKLPTILASHAQALCNSLLILSTCFHLNTHSAILIKDNLSLARFFISCSLKAINFETTQSFFKNPNVFFCVKLQMV